MVLFSKSMFIPNVSDLALAIRITLEFRVRSSSQRMTAYQKAGDILHLKLDTRKVKEKKILFWETSSVTARVRKQLETTASNAVTLKLIKDGHLDIGSEVAVSRNRVMRITKILDDHVEWEEQFKGYSVPAFPRLQILENLFREFYKAELSSETATGLTQSFNQ